MMLCKFRILNLLAAVLLGTSTLAVVAAEGPPHDHGAHDHEPQQAASAPKSASATRQAGVATAAAARLYEAYCSVCHGDNGDGQSRARAGLQPPPKDFTSYQVAAELTRERMIHAIRDGLPGTAMSGWQDRLDDTQIAALADYISSKFMPAVTTDEGHDGRRIYAEYCSVCHGDRGQGAVWAQSGLKPPPIDFTSDQAADLSRKRMIFSVTYGRPQTAMAAWGKRLTEGEIAAVIDYVQAAFVKSEPQESEPQESAAQVEASTEGDQAMGGAHDHSAHEHEDIAAEEASAQTATTEDTHDHDAHGLAEIDEPFANGLAGDAQVGGELYQNNCAECHGASGDGQGPRAYFIFPKPRDFTHPAARAQYSRSHLFETTAKGVIGSEMPAWDKVFTDQQIADVAEYVFTRFIRPEAEGGH